MSSGVAGGEGTICARRDRFGVTWDLSVRDDEDDGRDVTATIELDVSGARDPVASLENDLGDGTSVHSRGSFRPRFGSAIGDLAITTCVDIRLLPDRCRTSSAVVPQLASRSSPAQAARLEELVFEQSLDEFMATRADGDRTGVDADFDWSSDGCSAGPLATLTDERLEPACLRHDFAYRNLGQRFYGPTDAMRRRADEQLAADVEAVGRADLAEGLFRGLQGFAGPVFYGAELADVWGIPAFIARRLRTEAGDGSADARR